MMFLPLAMAFFELITSILLHGLPVFHSRAIAELRRFASTEHQP
jgi:hypothetical protein